jgi:hypothetical protein
MLRWFGLRSAPTNICRVAFCRCFARAVRHQEAIYLLDSGELLFYSKIDREPIVRSSCPR